MIVAVAADQMLKGAVVALGGLLLSTVGLDPISGYPRYIFGAVSLMEGVSFIPALIGLFAVAEALRLAEPGADTGAPSAQPHGWWVRRVDAVRCAWTTVKSAAIGTFVGAMPGAGCDIAAFLGYSEAKRAARPGERFGEGEVKGVAAPEAAKTAATSGAMIPLLSLGVPGDSVTAVMIGAFVIHGLQPGPLMFKEQQGLVHAVFALVLLAHLLVFVFGTAGARVFLRLVNVDRRLLAPAILLLSVVGAYAMRGNLADVWLMLGFGALGYAHAARRLSSGAADPRADPRADGGGKLPAGAGDCRTAATGSFSRGPSRRCCSVSRSRQWRCRPGGGPPRERGRSRVSALHEARRLVHDGRQPKGAGG
jgi:putative tricarboxylic transport membrane protein